MAKIPFTFRFDEVYYAKLKIVAEKKNRSMSNLIEYLCMQEIDAYENEYGQIMLSDDDIGLK